MSKMNKTKTQEQIKKQCQCIIECIIECIKEGKRYPFLTKGKIYHAKAIDYGSGNIDEYLVYKDINKLKTVTMPNDVYFSKYMKVIGWANRIID